MLGLKPEPLLPWDGVLLVVDRLLEDPFDFSTELGIYRLIFDMQLAQCCMPIPRTQKGKPTMASQPWPASADLNDREQILACFMGCKTPTRYLAICGTWSVKKILWADPQTAPQTLSPWDCLPPSGCGTVPLGSLARHHMHSHYVIRTQNKRLR